MQNELPRDGLQPGDAEKIMTKKYDLQEDTIPEKCYKCTPEAFEEFRPWMSSQLCERHTKETAQVLSDMAKAMAKTVPIQQGGVTNTTTSMGERLKGDFIGSPQAVEELQTES